MDGRWVLERPSSAPRPTPRAPSGHAAGSAIPSPAPGSAIAQRGADHREADRLRTDRGHRHAARTSRNSSSSPRTRNSSTTRDHAILAHERAKGVKKLVTIPGITHYGIYDEARDQAQKLAIEWYDEHLKD